MAAVVTYVFAAFVTWPVLVIVLTYVLQLIWSGHDRRKIKRSVDISVPFFMGAIYYMVLEIWLIDVWFPIVAAFIVMLAIALLVNWRIYDEVVLKSTFIKVWRVHFILYFVAYVSLMTLRVYLDLAG